FPGKIILHWYSGSLNYLENALSYGYYFSVNSAMLQSKNGINIIKTIPLNRLLLESDSPFVGVDRKSIIPYDMRSVISNISNIKQLSISEVEDALHQNFRNLIL